MATVKSRRAIANSELDLRDSMWPDAEDELWDRSIFGGFTTLPKTLPYVARIMDDLSKGFPLSQTYLALWCATWDNAFVRLNRPADLAFASGFAGERAERTWADRMRRLEVLGFVKTRPSGASRLGFAFIPNPHAVIFALYAAKSDPVPSTPEAVDLRSMLAGLTEGAFNAFVERALELGCDDVKALLKAANAKQAEARTQTAQKEQAPPAKPRSFRLRPSPKKPAGA